jgi:YD repeat-containing protein
LGNLQHEQRHGRLPRPSDDRQPEYCGHPSGSRAAGWPPVHFTVRYSHREAFQPANFTYSNFGPKWTCDWISYITDSPSNTLADVNYYIMGGGTRTFTGFDANSQTFAFQQFDQTLLKRTGPNSYEMLAGQGSKAIFGQPDGAIGNSRKIFLTQLLDPFGNAVTLTYDANLRIVAISDAIGQVTTLTYGNTNDIYKITRVTDPFGRFADFAYDSLGRLTNITDVIGLNSRFTYMGTGTSSRRLSRLTARTRSSRPKAVTIHDALTRNHLCRRQP